MKIPLKFFILSFIPSLLFGQWTQVGDDFNVQMRPNSVVFDSNNTPHMTITVDDSPDYIKIVKFENNSWVQVGEPIYDFLDGRVSVALNSADEIYVAYKHSDKPYHLSVKKMVGNTWVNIGTPFGSYLSGRNSTVLKFNSLDELYIAYLQAHLTVAKFNGNSWDIIFEDFDVFPEDSGYSFDLEIDGNNDLYLGYPRINGMPGKILKYVGNLNWEQLGSDFYFSLITSIAVDNTNKLSVCLWDIDENTLRVFRYNGSYWEQLGNNIDKIIQRVGILEISPNQKLYVAYLSQTPTILKVVSFENGKWTQVNEDITTSSTSFLNFSIDNYNVPYVTYYLESISKFKVKRNLSLLHNNEFHNGSDIFIKNPIKSNDDIFVNLGESYKKTNVNIYTISGMLVFQNTYYNEDEILISNNFNSGIYFLQIVQEDNIVKVTKLLIK